MTAQQPPSPNSAREIPFALIAKYDQRLPRYTSYPTAPHFKPASDDKQYRAWLGALTADKPVSLYLHVPFCKSLCWYCGCHMQVVNRDEPVVAYTDAMVEEIDLVGAAIRRRPTVRFLHWGGGTPTVLRASDMERVMAALVRNFDLAPEIEHSIELDPRTLTEDRVWALAELGVNRASLGVQDFNPIVQESVNRMQPVEQVERAVAWLRAAGIHNINFDLIYGLPFQTVESVIDTVSRAADLAPDRIALFGYAHVPWMKRHQKLLPEPALPSAEQRFAQAGAAADMLISRGYRRIGLDHFVRPDDPLAHPVTGERVTRNFQGYTADNCPVLLGFGASSISRLPQGYVQNTTDITAYRKQLADGRLPCARLLAFADDDLLRGEVIERLMCDMHVDLGEVALRHHADPAIFTSACDRLDPLIADGIVRRDGWHIAVTEPGRPLVRAVAALFDAYLAPADSDVPRHSQAI